MRYLRDLVAVVSKGSEARRSYFASRAEAYRYATRMARKKAPNTSISIRETKSRRGSKQYKTPWLVSIEQH
jgi:hypothetical protein